MDPGVHSDPQIGLQTRFLTSKLPRSCESEQFSWAAGHDSGAVSTFFPESAQTACYGLFGRQKPKGAFWGSESPQTDPAARSGHLPESDFSSSESRFSGLDAPRRAVCRAGLADSSKQTAVRTIGSSSFSCGPRCSIWRRPIESQAARFGS